MVQSITDSTRSVIHKRILVAPATPGLCASGGVTGARRRRAPHRGTVTSVKDLIGAIETFIDGWKERPLRTLRLDQDRRRHPRQSHPTVRRLQTRDTRCAKACSRPKVMAKIMVGILLPPTAGYRNIVNYQASYPKPHCNAPGRTEQQHEGDKPPLKFVEPRQLASAG